MALIKGKFGGFLNWLLRLLQKGKEKGVFDKKAPVEEIK